MLVTALLMMKSNLLGELAVILRVLLSYRPVIQVFSFILKYLLIAVNIKVHK